MTEELKQQAYEAIKTGELDYSICLDGGKVVNGQNLVKALVDALEEVIRICDFTPPLTIKGEHSEGWKWLAREIKEVLSQHKDSS